MSRLESYEINELFKNESQTEIQSEALPKSSDVFTSQRKKIISDFDSEANQQAMGSYLSSEARVLPQDLSDYLINAQLLLKNGEVALSINLFRAVLLRDPNNSTALKGMADSLAQSERYTESLPYFRALVKNCETAESWAELAGAAYNANEYDESYTGYVVAIERGLPDGDLLFSAYKNLGNILVLKSDLASAEKMYQMAFTLNPDSDVLMVNFGSLEIQKGDMNKAVQFFRKAVELNDQNDKAWVGLGLIHRQFADSELSWANIEKALDINPKNESAIRLVAEWSMKESAFNRAIRHLDAYLKLCDQDAQMTLWLAKFLYLSGQVHSAEIEANKALDLNPRLEGALEVYQVIREEIQAREARVTC